MPARVRSSVDLPLPLRPTMTVKCAGGIAKVDIGDYGDASMSVYVSGCESVGGESGVLMPGLFGTRIRISCASGCVLSVS